MSDIASRPHVFVATPCFGGLVTQGYMSSVINLMQYSAAAGFDASLSLLGCDALITRSRNTLVGRFLESPAATHLMFIDADIAFDPAQVGRLLRFDQDVVGGMYPLKVIHWDAEALLRAAHRVESMQSAPLLYVGRFCEGAALRRQDGFVTGIYAGSGFLMIKRQVIERMIAAYPETRYTAGLVYPPPPSPEPARFALFDCMIDPDTGTYLSEDFTFCRRWRSIGGTIWLDTAGTLTHAGTHGFCGSPAARCQPQRAVAA
jgi:hypothetical protein